MGRLPGRSAGGPGDQILLEQALIDIQKVCLSRSVIYVAGASKL